jgi:Tfp pilus assembly protein PilF
MPATHAMAADEIPRCLTGRHPRRVLLVGWDAADWQLIEPLIARGLMPTLEAFRRSGSWGPLATVRPILSPVLWNTVATGKRADHHGVHGFTEPAPGGAGVRPVSSTTRRCKALWNIATRCGLATHVVGWYASHPAEPIAGVMVSNQFEHCVSPDGGQAPVPPGSVHPVELAAELAACRVHPAEIDAAAILPFVPDAARLATTPGHRLGRLRMLLAQAATVHAVATKLIARDDWDLAAVYYEAIDRFGHEFMEFHPPRMEQVGAEDFAAYRHCMESAYRFHDMLLDTLLQLAGPDTAVILISDHGYFSDERRPDPRPGRSGPVAWHRPYGIFAAAGPGIRPGGTPYGAGLLDVAPTVLSLLGLPAGLDMPGRVLEEVLDGVPSPARIDSWETVDGHAGMHPPGVWAEAGDERAAVEQLVALGYIERPAADDDAAARQAVDSNRLQLAQSFADTGNYRAALAELSGVDATLATTPSVRALEASWLIGAGDLPAAREILDELRAAGHASGGIEMLSAAVECSAGHAPAALGRLERLAVADPKYGQVHERIGQLRLAMGRPADAVEAFERALAIDPQDAGAHCGLAEARLALGQAQAALESGLLAAGLVHTMPRAHHAIGRALQALGDREGALEALRVCVRQAPHWAEPRRTLAALETPAGA